ncbi:MAG: hypothetical protein KDA28_11325, partial [Phycisphaerales bacterium]|nr:hypothetical protein [Phycisphaerales bacterium]
AGDETTQLTWMDAQRDGVTFTPRHGKAVEINALWIHGMGCVDRARPGRWEACRSKAIESFRSSFRKGDGLHDVLVPPHWTPSREVRPNQVFAASLEFGPLTDAERRGVASVVDATLRVAVGLRTLDATDPGYRARYEGPIFERDGAYHNGTAWPWLSGALIEAWWRVGEATRARAVLEGLLGEVGRVITDHVPEIYDAEATDGAHRPDGCPAQAWSVAEILRTSALLIRQ